MGAASSITQEMRDAIGIEWEPFVIQVDNWLVKLFLDAVEDYNPLYCDAEFAKKTRFKGAIVPPGIFSAALMRNEQTELPFDVPLKRMLDGGGDFEFLTPLRVGDVLTARTKVDNITERQGKAGPMVFIYILTTWTNQRNEVVANSHAVRICY